ncbi:hypothetical protein TNCV_4677751 [Trichonephila clavipes]|nr:hypothetical protein TNCV_4677751 [Trichonephila clavipes]
MMKDIEILVMERLLDHALSSMSLEPIHFIVLAVTNPWLQYKQDTISNKIPPKIKMDFIKFKFEVAEVLAESPPTNKSIFTDDEDDSAVTILVELNLFLLLP